MLGRHQFIVNVAPDYAVTVHADFKSPITRLPGKCQNNGNSNTRRCLIAGGMMLLRFVLLSALALPLTANSQGQVSACCGLGSEKLSQRQVKSLLEKTEPIQAPCCADMIHINGTVVLTISVDSKGNVTCVQVVSGHALIVGVAIDSVRQWKFQPYGSKGIKKSFCGQIAVRFKASEYGVRYKIV